MVTGLHEHTLAVVGCRTGADARMSCQNREKGAQKRENLQQALNSCSLCVPGCMRTKCGKQVCSRCRCNSCKSTRWKFWAQAKWSESWPSFICLYHPKCSVAVKTGREETMLSFSPFSWSLSPAKTPQMTLNTSCVPPISEISNENKIKPI